MILAHSSRQPRFSPSSAYSLPSHQITRPVISYLILLYARKPALHSAHKKGASLPHDPSGPAKACFEHASAMPQRGALTQRFETNFLAVQMETQKVPWTFSIYSIQLSNKTLLLLYLAIITHITKTYLALSIRKNT
jgi:hypothetical protein